MEAEGDDTGVGAAVDRINLRDEQLKGRLKELINTMKMRKSLREELEARETVV